MLDATVSSSRSPARLGLAVKLNITMTSGTKAGKVQVRVAIQASNSSGNSRRSGMAMFARVRILVAACAMLGMAAGGAHAAPCGKDSKGFAAWLEDYRASAESRGLELLAARQRQVRHRRHQDRPQPAWRIQGHARAVPRASRAVVLRQQGQGLYEVAGRPLEENPVALRRATRGGPGHLGHGNRLRRQFRQQERVPATGDAGL